MWKQVVVVVLLALVAASSARKVYDESGWRKVGNAKDTDEINLIIAVKQSHTAELERIFWDVSNPASPNYGKYLTNDEVHQLVKPNADSLKSVVAWLGTNGIYVSGSAFSGSKDFIHVTTTAGVASRMLGTKYELYAHATSSRLTIKAAVGDYEIPKHLQPHIDFIVGHTSFPLTYKPSFTAMTLAPADEVNPLVIRARYNITNSTMGTHKNNSYAVAEFQDEFLSPTDLVKFFSEYVPYAPSFNNVSHIIGKNDASQPGDEAMLDIEYIMSVAPAVSAWFWSTPSMDFYSDITKWLSLIDNTTEAPWIQSVSYGTQGGWPSAAYRARIDLEFMKSGVRGISLIIASGDDGSGCIKCKSFKPSWPASSAYVTSVGATTFFSGNSGAEKAVTSFPSGGGFSPYDGAPDYQKAAVAHYFKVETDLPDQSFYNASGRATPDVAALGDHYAITLGGHTTHVGGTSASTPVFAAIVALLNDIRLNQRKPVLGFVNPWLYSITNPAAFFDVTEGDNADDCCKKGWSCAPGWDPVTGLGTPNFAVLKTLV